MIFELFELNKNFEIRELGVFMDIESIKLYLDGLTKDQLSNLREIKIRIQS